MNTLIAFFCLLAVAAAEPGHLGLAYAHHAAPIALASEARLIDPVAIAAGAPLPTGDTVEVAAAKAAHLHAHAVETNRNIGLHAYNAHVAPLAYAHHAAPFAHAYAAPIAHHAPLAYAHHAPLAYAHHAAPIAHHVAPVALASEPRLIDPVAIAAGAPLPTGDTVEVAAAKAAHLHAHAVESARTGHHLLYKRGLAYAAHPLAYAPISYSAAATHHVSYPYARAHLLYKRGLGYAHPLIHAAPISYSAVASHHVSYPYARAHLLFKRGLGYAHPLAYASPALSYSAVATRHLSYPYAFAHHY